MLWPVGLVYKERFFWVIRKGSFFKKERFFLQKGKVLLTKNKGFYGNEERFLLHFSHRKGFFWHKKAFLSFPCPTPNHRGKVPFGHRKGSFWTQGSFFGPKSFPVLNLGNIMQRMRDGGRVVQSRISGVTECRGRVLPGQSNVAVNANTIETESI